MAVLRQDEPEFEADLVQRRRGRPQRLPYDATPLDQPEIDVVHRTAWLYATARLLSPATAQLGRPEFIEAVRESGIVLDAPRLSRWESGTTAAPLRLLTAYEDLTESPSGSLRAAAGMIQRVGRGALPALPETSRADEDIDDLLEQALTRDITGDRWLDLTSELTRFDRIYLPAETWTALCTRLVNELTRATGLSFVRRYEAAALLMRHPTSRRHLTRALGVVVMHPDVQNAVPALTLLSEVGDEAAGELVVRLTGTSNRPLRRATIGVAAVMAARDLLPPGSQLTLESIAAAELSKGGGMGRRIAAIELATQLPEQQFERVVAAMPDGPLRAQVMRARVGRELAPPDLARSVAETVASQAEASHQRAAHDPDQMLRRLVRESLFHVQRERRQLAATMISVSPYARATSQAVLRLTHDRHDLVSARAWAMLGRLSHVLDRNELRSCVREHRPALRARAFNTLGLVPGPLEDDVADGLLDSAHAPEHSLRHAATFALGMAGHRHVRHLENSELDDVRRASEWWVALGPAIHDDDLPAPPTAA